MLRAFSLGLWTELLSYTETLDINKISYVQVRSLRTSLKEMLHLNLALGIIHFASEKDTPKTSIVLLRYIKCEYYR